MVVSVPISIGELLDKISINNIKNQQITDQNKLTNVVRELNELVAIYNKLDFPNELKLALNHFMNELSATNLKIWHIEDDIRNCERHKDFGQKFVELARSVYITNDARAAIKRKINDLVGSAIVEEKSYTNYQS